MAVAKCVHNCDVESKPSANAGMGVSTSNVCEKASVDINRLSDKFVQSATVKREPQDCHEMCLPKDAVVKSEKDVKYPAMSEKDKTATPFGKEPQKKKWHRSHSFSSDSEGDKPPSHSVICLPKYDGMSIRF